MRQPITPNNYERRSDYRSAGLRNNTVIKSATIRDNPIKVSDFRSRNHVPAWECSQVPSFLKKNSNYSPIIIHSILLKYSSRFTTYRLLWCCPSVGCLIRYNSEPPWCDAGVAQVLVVSIRGPRKIFPSHANGDQKNVVQMRSTCRIIRNDLITHNDRMWEPQCDVAVLALFEHEYEESRIFRNVGNYLPGDTARHSIILET